MTPIRAHELFAYRDGALYWKTPCSTKVKPGDRAGTTDPRGYRYIKADGRCFKEHRVIYLMHHGDLPKFIDHIDGNPSNNKIENLRPASISANTMNSRAHKDNASGVKGVCWHKHNKKWHVQVTTSGKRKSVGYFDDLDLAELVAIEARNKYHGEFARHK